MASSDTEPPSSHSEPGGGGPDIANAAAAAGFTTMDPSCFGPGYSAALHAFYVAQVASHLGAAQMAGEFHAQIEARLNANERFPAWFVTFKVS